MVAAIAPHGSGIPDTSQIRSYLAHGMAVRHSNLDSSLYYNQQALRLARRLGFKTGEARAQVAVANDLYNAGKFVAAGQAYEAAVWLAQRTRLCDVAGKAYNGMGLVGQALGNVQGAIAYFNKARQVYAACLPIHPRNEALLLTNIGNTYIQSGQFAEAEKPLRQAMAGVTAAVDAPTVLNLLDLVGLLQQHQQHLDSAVVTWQRELALANQVGNRRAQSYATANLSTACLQRGQPDAALAYAQQAMRLARQLGNQSQITDNTLVLARALHATRRPGAFDTLSRYVGMLNALVGQTSAEAVAQAQARFNVEGQQARIRALEQQRRIAELENAHRTARNRLLLGGAVLASLLLGLAGLNFHRRRQQRREEKLRSQLAADLHDDVGTLLSQIALQTDLLQEGLAPPDAQQGYLAEVADNSRMAVRQLNDVVWNLDAHNDTVPNLLDRLRDYAHDVLVPTGRDVRFETDVPWENPQLPAPVRRHLYFIYKEALHNILKHAPASATVTVGLHRRGPHLVLEVVNDGPVSSAVAPERNSGHGLRNMQTRAQAMGGSATATAREGAFAVRVQVPVRW
ncbi:tetratricopeptide repeat-containing sensor histidine kinase [Hymenobacter properus]|uniref:Tetratricopeptide repeat protein n=1 Tax=Hymenobacter properus TaxID=2791026 RepID=A0A931FP36_9BACT|nr:tetratricopeptide repeat protein [Hymenobacter properus]MBF9143234.1 tetratricopeptide repeat protein [Hymenobacter properus]MBR7722044.1 tetratricopeptide repeat protein [Microvirga sp. SRT04]